MNKLILDFIVKASIFKTYGTKIIKKINIGTTQGMLNFGLRQLAHKFYCYSLVGMLSKPQD
jgi:hypothetical protein